MMFGAIDKIEASISMASLYPFLFGWVTSATYMIIYGSWYFVHKKKIMNISSRYFTFEVS